MIEASEAHLWLNLLNRLPEMLCSLAVLPGTFLRRLRQGLTRMWLWSGLGVFVLISCFLGVAEVRELARELRYRVIPR